VPPRTLLVPVALLALAIACSRGQPSTTTQTERPSILLVTLDTTRADAVGPDATRVATPAFNAVAARGRRFTQAYATVPETLPSHASMMTGLYPAGHGLHENARYLAANVPVLAEKLQQSGYRTAAFVSSFVLARRFGLARGFDIYDDELAAGLAERTSKETSDRAIAHLGTVSSQPQLVWVHYFDPHAPYRPPQSFLEQYEGKPYLGEIAAMDAQLGRLIAAFDAQTAGAGAVIVVADHGEGLGDHGESQHGTLLYQSTMHVPLVIAGPGVTAGVSTAPVSTRRVFHTVLDWAGLGSQDSLRGSSDEVVLGEAMKPFLEYGWQPQTMAVDGQLKAITAGKLEAYDVASDPGETRNLGSGANLPSRMRKSLDDYPAPAPAAARAAENLSDEAKQRLASLGYIGATSVPVVRKDAPRPADMAHLFGALETASSLFVRERYAEAIPLLQKILASDPYNLDATLRLATAHSALGHDEDALAAFAQAARLAPQSQDVRTYLALHYERGRDWQQAIPLLEQVVADSPDRVPAVEALGRLRLRQGRAAMTAGDTAAALTGFEAARRWQGPAFKNDLELGVLYLASRRLTDARDALDRVPSSHPEYPMALFKRAQVSVLLKEADAPARIAAARQHADPTTRTLIENERLFRGR
jgi:arylsulfatase A-like enzyme/Tfp pilus assembly protein PilF